MQIDIRAQGVEKVDSIVFGTPKDECDAYILTLSGEFTKIESIDSQVFIGSEVDANHLIKALQKAIELGNWSE